MRAREALVVVDLGYGDQGKGSVTDHLVRDREAHTVVRYNGGAQAGHNVVTPDGRHHTFAQFGAGSFVPGVETFVSRHVAIQPWAMVVEAEHLARAGVGDAFERTAIDGGAPVITPFHRAANRLRERARGARRHGSCGVGVGEAVSDARALDEGDVVRARDLFDRAAMEVKFERVRARKRAELAEEIRALRDDAGARDDLECFEDRDVGRAYLHALDAFRRRARVAGERHLRDVLRRPGAVVFEGAQGVLLDEWRGFHPYTTWSTCTDENAASLLAEHGFDGPSLHLGVVRAYATRHGAGPLVTEDPDLTARLPDPHNGEHPWQGRFRVGWADAVATRYAMRACGRIDALAVTCLDRLRDVAAWRLATRYAVDGHELHDLEPGPRGDLAAQSALTDLVSRATPLYEITTREADPYAHLDALASHTARVALISFGPTTLDKRWLDRPAPIG